MRHTLIAAALLAAPAAAMADGLSYTYADLRYFSSDSDAVSINFQGGSLSGSFALTDTFFIAADVSYAKSEDYSFTFLGDTVTGSFNQTTESIRIGAHVPLTETLDLVGSAGGLFAQISGEGDFDDGESENATGFVVELGLRLLVAGPVELGAFYSYQNASVDDGDSDERIDNSAFKIDAQYHITPNWSAVAAAINGDSNDQYSAGVRYNF